MTTPKTETELGRLWQQHRDLLEQAARLLPGRTENWAKASVENAEAQAEIWHRLGALAPAPPWAYAAARMETILHHHADTFRQLTR